MRTIAPPLAPIFRSQHQLLLLTELFLATEAPLTIGGLAERTGVPQASVSREVERLRRHGVVTVRALGRNRLVEANRALPWYREVRDLLAKTMGPPALLAGALESCAGIVAAYIFGSWAARYYGEVGPFARDVDVLIVGEPDVPAVHRACEHVEQQLGLDVNPLIVSAAEWILAQSGHDVLAHVRTGPLVQIAFTSSPPA